MGRKRRRESAESARRAGEVISQPLLGAAPWCLRVVTDGSCHVHGLSHATTIYEKDVELQPDALDRIRAEACHFYPGEGHVVGRGLTPGMAELVGILMGLHGIIGMHFFNEVDIAIARVGGEPRLGRVNLWNKVLRVDTDSRNSRRYFMENTAPLFYLQPLVDEILRVAVTVKSLGFTRIDYVPPPEPRVQHHRCHLLANSCASIGRPLFPEDLRIAQLLDDCQRLRLNLH